MNTKTKCTQVLFFFIKDDTSKQEIDNQSINPIKGTDYEPIS